MIQTFLDAAAPLHPQSVALVQPTDLGEIARATLRSYRQLPMLLHSTQPVDGRIALRLWLIAHNELALGTAQDALARALQACGEILFAHCAACGHLQEAQLV